MVNIVKRTLDSLCSDGFGKLLVGTSVLGFFLYTGIDTYSCAGILKEGMDTEISQAEKQNNFNRVYQPNLLYGFYAGAVGGGSLILAAKHKQNKNKFSIS